MARTPRTRTSMGTSGTQATTRARPMVVDGLIGFLRTILAAIREAVRRLFGTGTPPPAI